MRTTGRLGCTGAPWTTLSAWVAWNARPGAIQFAAIGATLPRTSRGYTVAPPGCGAGADGVRAECETGRAGMRRRDRAVRSRSEERRVGKEWRSRWWAEHLRKQDDSRAADDGL